MATSQWRAWLGRESMKNELNKFISKISTTMLNVSMAILILMPQGWAIITAILLLEVSLFYFLLKRQYKFGELFWRLAISSLNGGWLGAFWFPWVSSYEIEFMSPYFIIYFLIIFIITLIIEIPINIFLFRKLGIKWGKTLLTSLLVNAITNIGCAFIIYLFSFNIIKF